MKRHFASIAMMGTALFAALAFYIVSLKVSAERHQMEALRGSITRDMADIRALQAELRTRSRLPQLERWNAGRFLLAAPKPQQLLRNVAHLTAVDRDGAVPRPALPSQVHDAPPRSIVVAAAEPRENVAVQGTSLAPIIAAALSRHNVLPAAASAEAIVDPKLAELARIGRAEQEAAALGALELR